MLSMSTVITKLLPPLVCLLCSMVMFHEMSTEISVAIRLLQVLLLKLKHVYQEQTQQVSFVSDLVRTGYLYSNNLLTNVGYYSVMKQFVSVENLRNLNLWPCPSTISIGAFVAAGYGSYSGHLTTLGTYLYHAQYFSTDLLIRLGIHLHDDFYMYHHALNYGGYISSSYHETHSAVHSALTYPSYGVQAAQVSLLLFICYMLQM